MTFNKKILNSQALILIFLWLLLLIIPLLFENRNDGELTIPKVWFDYGWVFILFLINRFVLMPYLFFKDKHLSYFIIISLLTIALITAMFFSSSHNKHKISKGKTHIELLHYKQIKNRRYTIPPIANFFILTVLIIGFDTALNIYTRWMASEQKRAKLENENTNVKLALLRNQISPHFFMNTLNNIHSLVDIDKERSKDAIIRLSRLMSYLLYETNVPKVALRNEFEFIENYVDLMRLRYSNKVKIENTIENEIPNINVPPLLFLNFIENAFKHGVSYKDESFIRIKFLCHENSIEFNIQNIDYSKRGKSNREGLGIENARNRLDLIYGNKYKLNIEHKDKLFLVNLNIPV